MGFLLIAIGAVFALIFILNNLLQTLRRRERIGFWGTFLAFGALLVPVFALTTSALAAAAGQPVLQAAALGIAVVCGVASLLLFVLEARRPLASAETGEGAVPAKRGVRNSRAALSFGVGVLLAVSTALVPTVVAAMSQLPTPPPASVGPSVAELSKRVEVAAAVPTATATLEPTATLTRPVLPTPTPTNTPFIYASPVAETTDAPTGETAQGGSSAAAQTVSDDEPSCAAVVNVNLNLRRGPSTEAAVILTVPTGTTVVLYGPDDTGEWWFADYQAESGWLSAEFLSLDDACAALPERAS